jgi:PAS domain S-box-containing protein
LPGEVRDNFLLTDEEQEAAGQILDRDNPGVAALLHAQPVPHFVIDKNHNIVHWNKALEHYSGIPAGDMIGTTQQWKAFYPEKRPCMADLLLDREIDTIPQWYAGKYQKSVLVEGAYEATDFFPHMGENGVWLHFTATLIRDSRGSVVGASETLEDITAARRAEQALADSEKRYRQLISATTDYVYMVRIGHGNATETEHGAGCEAVTGYTSGEFAADPRLWLSLVVEEDHAAVLAQANDLLARKPAKPLEHRIIRKDGVVRWVANTPVPRYSPEGQIIAYDGLVQDITGRKVAEESLKGAYHEMEARVRERTAELLASNECLKTEVCQREQLLAALQESEAIYKIIGELIPFGTWISNPTGEISYISESFLTLTGMSMEECKGFGWTSRLPPKESDQTIAKWKQCFEKSDQIDCVCRIRGRDGEYRSILRRGVPVRNKKGAVLSWAGINLDITEREKTRLLLENRTHRLNFAEQIAHLGSWEWDINTGTEYWSDELYRILGYQAPDTQPAYQMVVDAIHPDDKKRVIGVFQNALDEKKPYITEFRIIRPDGSLRFVEARGEAEQDGHGMPVKMLGSIQDITGRKRMEEEITSSLKEKELLLQEVHHRVKNSMQVISSIISIQSRKIEDTAIKELFRETRNRIKSVAFIHEKLYQSKSLVEIDYREYLQLVIGHLYRSYNIDPKTIRMVLESDAILMNIEKAIPCSLIINELISNSFKYAFPDGMKGEIRIDLTSGCGGVTLTYADNGIGLPENMDFSRTGTLGLQLIMALSKQLQGQITVERDKGTRYILTFPLEEDNGALATQMKWDVPGPQQGGG